VNVVFDIGLRGLPHGGDLVTFGVEIWKTSVKLYVSFQYSSRSSVPVVDTKRLPKLGSSLRILTDRLTSQHPHHHQEDSNSELTDSEYTSFSGTIFSDRHFV
jgi:hypothetical protein